MILSELIFCGFQFYLVRGLIIAPYVFRFILPNIAVDLKFP